MQATDGEAAAGRPVVEIEGRKYRRTRRYVSLGSKVYVTVTDGRKQIVIEVLEPVGGK